ncbi:MAG: phosphoglycerate kinase, partial [Bacteroidetes bacterium]|nr:phosphoglycerate kinase [Bacteroidota bacterium]
MKTVADHNFKGERALVRVDFNVPLDEQLVIMDDSRMRAVLPTLRKILDDGGSAIIMSHLGRPMNGVEDKYSLRHLQDHLKELLDVNVYFVADCVGEEVTQKVKDLGESEVLLLENTRFYPEEASGDDDFAKGLSELADVFVNDAFGTAHRAHASTTIVANYFSEDSKMFGYLMAKEIMNAEKALRNPQRPFTAILGGAKVSDKIQLIERLMNIVDNVIIGGGMAYTFVKAQGGEIGKSLVEDEQLDLAARLLAEANSK